YWKVDDWQSIKQKNHDRWFPFSNKEGIGPKENEGSNGLKVGLEEAAAFWKQINKQHNQSSLPHHHKIAYVYGLDAHTPCGLTQDSERLFLHGTTRGDGSVSWDSGRLEVLAQAEREWYMPVPHSNLTNTPEHFAAIAELLRDGKTRKLSKKAPRTRSSAAESYHYNAGPVLQPGAEDLALSFFGGRPHRQPEPDTTQVLEVSVRAMDLRFARYPIMCGHYVGDSIAGAEADIDHHLLGGALSQRERLGIYAGDLGTSTVVLNSRTSEEKHRGSGRGAIIVGLGEWSKISADALKDTVRDGVLQYLLHTSECQLDNDETKQDISELSLNSLLLGYNSTTHITVAGSMEAIVKGVCEANQQYQYNRGKQPERAIRKLEFIEFYMDTAITAAYSVRELPYRLEKELKLMQARIVPKTELQFKEGMRQRLSERSTGNGYWSRLMVTDADQRDAACPAHCYENKVSPIPQPVLDTIKAQGAIADNASLSGEQTRQQPVLAKPYAVAERIKYVYLSERARAEAISQQRQPGLIEALIKDAIKDCHYNPDISRTLFQLMVPVEFKSSARQTNRLLLVLDGYTANLPWEMLQADDEPLAQKMAIVRQLVSTRFRRTVIASTAKTACVIGNPSTAGFYRHFPHHNQTQFNADYSLATLSGATSESQAVAQTLHECGYEVEKLFPRQASDKPHHTAIDVFNTLFKRPYRILMIAAHGEVNIRGVDGKERTGVILSDGVMLTAAEVGQMEVVPDLVFLNCCHLAATDNQPEVSYNRLAYSVSRELIEMGVRCVIAAGWAVNDAAASTFSKTFFKHFVEDGQPFGDAVLNARQRTHKLHADLNTWGAYQAYGDPNYVLSVDNEQDVSSEEWTPVAPQELDQRLSSKLVDIQHLGEKSQQIAYKRLVNEIDNDLSRVPQAWISKPSTQYKLAQLYGSMLPEGFEKARAACQRSIFEQDRDKKVPIVALELLGNLEARQAEALSEAAEALLANVNKVEQSDQAKRQKDKQIKPLKEQRAQYFIEANELATSAIKRFEGLLGITHEMHKVLQGGEGSADVATNTERFALLGSALKCKAVVLCRQGKSWSTVRKVLEASAKAYRKGEGVSFDYKFDPYASINYLQLSGVLNQPVENAQQHIEKSQEAARRNFLKTLDFSPAVSVADAEVAAFLLSLSKSITPEKALDVSDQAEALLDYFEDSVKDVPRSSRQYHTVVQQLYCLALFLKKQAVPVRGDKSDVKALKQRAQEKAKILETVATELKKQ
ncbi:MAG: CHAT domain-containing protein, partial [Leucothrix sp.]